MVENEHFSGPSSPLNLALLGINNHKEELECALPVLGAFEGSVEAVISVDTMFLTL